LFSPNTVLLRENIDNLLYINDDELEQNDEGEDDKTLQGILIGMCQCHTANESETMKEAT